MAINVDITTSAVGAAILNAADPSAVRWIRVNADNTITYRTAEETLQDIGVVTDSGNTFYVSVNSGGANLAATDGANIWGFTAQAGALKLVSNSVTYTFPNSDAAGVLTSDGSGNLSWSSVSAGVTIGDAITGGSANGILFEDASNNLAQSANFTYDGATESFNAGASDAFFNVDGASKAIIGQVSNGTYISQLLADGVGFSLAHTPDGVSFFGVTSDASNLFLTAGTTTYTIPNTDGSNGQVLQTNGSGVLSWVSASSGITINSTGITGGGANRFLFENSSNQVSEVATDFYFDNSSSYATVIASGRTGTISGVGAVAFGYQALGANTSGASNVGIGYQAAALLTTGAQNIAIGYQTLYQGGANPSGCVAIGYQAGYNAANSSQSIFIGNRAGYTVSTVNYAIAIGDNIYTMHNSSFVVGRLAVTTAANQIMFGSNDGTHGGFNDFCVGQGNTSTSPTGFVLRTTGGSGTNINGGDLRIQAGLPTGNGANVSTNRNGIISFWTGDPGASGTTLRSATEKWRITQPGNLTNTGAATSAYIGLKAGTTSLAQLNLAASTAPSSPVDGDIWFDGSDLKIRVSGVTYTLTKS